MSSDEEIVPGDEDEQGIEDMDIKIHENVGQRRKVRRKIKKKNLLRVSTSAPEVNEYKITLNADNKNSHRCRASSTISEGQDPEFTESDENSGSSSQSLQFHMEDSLPSPDILSSDRSPLTNSRKIKKEPKSRQASSPMKLSRGLRKTSTAFLRRAGTRTDLKEETKSRKKSGTDATASSYLILSHFYHLLTDSDSGLMRVILQYATKRDCSEGTQNALLYAVTELILKPDSGITTTPQQFLSAYLNSDIRCHEFTFEEWKVFTAKNSLDGPRFTSLTTHLDSIKWWHIAECYLIVIFTKSSFFRDAFRLFTGRIDKNAGNSRKKHKIFPMLFSFFSELNKDTEKIPVIFIETLGMIKEMLSGYIPEPLTSMGALFRIVTSAIASIMYNPRKWNFDLAADYSPFLRRTLQNISQILESALLEPDYKCDSEIESSLVENISSQIQQLLIFSSGENELNTLPRFMTWTDSQPSLNTLYNHLQHNFDKIWPNIIQKEPSLSYNFIMFPKISILATVNNTLN